MRNKDCLAALSLVNRFLLADCNQACQEKPLLTDALLGGIMKIRAATDAKLDALEGPPTTCQVYKYFQMPF